MVNELSMSSRSSRSTPSLSRRWLATAAAGVAACVVGFASPSEAQAQEADGPDQVSPTAKGIVGGALLGAEIVVIPMGAAGLKPWWPYVVFGSVGAGGGAVAGWAVEKYVEPAEPALYMLAGGLALIIPALVLSLNATTRDEFEDDADPSTTVTAPQEAPTDQPPPADGAPPPDGAQPGSPDGTTTIKVESDARRHQRRRRARAPMPTALFDLASSEVRMGVPNIQVSDIFTKEELAKYGVEQETQVNIPIFGASF